MNEKLNLIKTQYEELSARLEQPETYANASVYTEIERRIRELEPIVSAYAKLQLAEAQIQEASEFLADAEMRAFALEELEAAKAEREAAQFELNRRLLPKDPKDSGNIIMEIRGGVGGEEGMLFASDLFRMYCMFADSLGWNYEVYNISETELGGIKEISFLIKGDHAYSRLKYEGGTHRVQRVPATESGGRIHTSAATVAVLPEISEVELQIDPKDLKIDTYRSSGAGGQHVNKTESAIRITHLPSGIVVECQDERSQYKNKDRAMGILRSRLYELEKNRKQAEIDADRREQVGSGDRSERIRTYNFPQNRVTDHRLEGEERSYSLNEIMNGRLHRLTETLMKMDQMKKLAEIKQE